MRKINCIIVDDESPAIAQMEMYVSRIPSLNLMGSFGNALEPIKFIRDNHIDLIFMDIEMEGFNGIQFLRTVSKRPDIILTTAYDEYAVEAFDLNVTDYLLKPISFERFDRSVDKVIAGVNHREVALNQPSENTVNRDFFFAKIDYKYRRVDFNSILLIQGMKDYLHIHTTSTRHLTMMNFKSMEEKLPSSNFIRVHKSFIVAKDKIELIEKRRVMILNRWIPVGPTYRERFWEAMRPGSVF